MTESPNNNRETFAWFRQQMERDVRYPSLCLKLAREARGIGPLYPSAITAQLATPKEDRVYKKENIRRGMVGYWDSKNDSNPYGHIATFSHQGDDGIWRCYSNVTGGRIAVVPVTLFEQGWGDTFHFGATSLNSVDLDLPPTKEERERARERKDARMDREHAEQEVRRVLRILRDEIAYQREEGRSGMANALVRDLRRLRAAHSKLLG